MIKTFYSLTIIMFTTLLASGVTIGNQAHAVEINFTSFSVEPFTDVERDGRRSLHIRLCGNGLSIDGRKIFGSQCARLKTDMKSGSRWQHHIIFESSRFSVFPIKTSNRDGANYKFWLRERSIADTQNFSSFLKKAPADGQLVIGAICKQLTNKNFFNQVIARKVQNRNAAGNLDRRVMDGVSLERAVNELTKIAKRCTNTAERIVGPIQVSTGTLLSPKIDVNTPTVAGYKICNFRNTKGPLTSSNIRKMQSGLKSLGYYFGKIDGDFGTGSCKGLTSFMKFKNSKIFDEAMYSALVEVSKPQVAKVKSTSTPSWSVCGLSTNNAYSQNYLKDMQRGLRDRGIYKGLIDGKFGAESCNGLSLFLEIEAKSQYLDQMAVRRLISKPSKAVLQQYQSAGEIVVSNAEACKQSRNMVRKNQKSLAKLGLYSSLIDGFVGPNYIQGVEKAERLLKSRADGNSNCLNENERLILEAIALARKNGSTCGALDTPAQINNLFRSLRELSLTYRANSNSETVSGLIWAISISSRLEQELATQYFYKSSVQSKRDCSLDQNEISALAPEKLQDFNIAVKSLSTKAIDINDKISLRLVAKGDDLQTSKMSKSIFGSVNEASIDIRFGDFKGKSVLDFVISEDDTKVNLHFYQNKQATRNLAMQMPELFIDDEADGKIAFHIRIFDNGTTNIKNGEFAKIVSQMPQIDRAMIAALCGQVEKISASSEGFVASFATVEERDMFRRSEFSREPVRKAVSLLAKQCVDEIKTKGLVTASFDVEAQVPVCTSKQNELLSKLDSDIEAGQTSLQGFRDDITALKVERPEFERVQCDAYVDELKAAESTLAQTEQRIAQETDTLSNLNTDIKEGQELLVQLNDLGQSSNLCNLESDELKQRINTFVQSQNPAATELLCSDDYTKSPLQIVIDEINITISRLLDEHISSDEVAEMRRQIGVLEQERIELTKLFAAISARKASPKELAEQTQINEGLQNTVADVEAQVSALEDEILNLRAVMNDNTSLIEEIDTLNQQLVDLTSEKQRVQNVLEELKSEVLQAQADITQRELQLEKTTLQIQDLEVQLGAASSTSVSLQEEVVELSRNIEIKQENVEELNSSVASAQALIDDANSVIAQNSQEVAKLDIALNARNAEAITLSSSLEKLSPQADAAEQTVLDLEASLAADFVPLDQFKEQESRLNDLTQTVTERTKLIRELRSDLEAIEGEEQLLVKMCLADAKCKAAMGDRLGVE